MQEADGKEHEVAGCDVGREFTGGDSHVTVRLHMHMALFESKLREPFINNHTHIHTYIHAYIHTYIHSYIHTTFNKL